MTTIFDSFLDQALRTLPPATLRPARKRATPPAGSALTGRYVRFLSIDVRHEFYNRDQGVCTDIAIEPTPRTRERLKLYGYIVRCRDDGVDLFWDAGVQAQANGVFADLQRRFGQVPADIWARLYEPPLLFTLRLREPRFAVFTDMPSDFRIGDPPLQLSSRANIPGADGEARLAIDWSAQLDRPSIVESRGMEGLGNSAPPEDAKPEPKPLAPQDQGPAARERGQFERRSQAFALLDLHFTRADPAPSDAWDGMPVDRTPATPRSGPPSFFRPVRYTLGFEARRTRWRYLVAARDGSVDAASLSVVGPDGCDAGFRRDDAPRRLPDGRVAACLTADDPRAILASPDAHLALMGRPLAGRSWPRALVDRLPGPSSENILPASAVPPTGDQPPAWSDIYVFV
ncbi:hypothetical protein [Sphingomonas sp. LM7]|uniref:hypothetical protein n=1 Tax=Sphingomonas sp. LM7 TaxID=1938607 RepID=UPI000983ACF6|nr:hypothetical protein [Sphingomonas sp. LM7]AQR73689.1 hypothetical protein BXU08_08600 [Sphingomonas sp. LM7]